MRRLLVVLVLLAVGRNAAGDPPQPAPKPSEPAASPTPAAKSAAKSAAKPLTPEQSADAVLAAVKSEDSATLKTLAANAKPDPWLVADELCARGEVDAALRFAKAAPRKDVEGLPAAVEARRGKPGDAAAREALKAGNARLEQKDPEGAIAAVKPLGEGLDDIASIRLAHLRALAHEAAKRPAETVAEALKASDRAANLGWLSRASDALLVAAMSSWKENESSQAVDLFTRRLAIDESRGDAWRIAQSLRIRGLILFRSDRYAESIRDHERALPMLGVGWQPMDRAIVLQTLGRLHDRLKNTLKARAYYEQSLAVEATIGDSVRRADTLRDLGDTYEATKDYEKALGIQGEALAMSQRVGDAEGEQQALSNLGDLEAALLHPEEARRYYERRLGRARASADDEAIGDALDDLAVFLTARGEYLHARDLLDESLTHAEKAGDDVTIEFAAAHLGLALQGLGDYPAAARAIERAIALAARRGDRNHVETNQLNLASTYLYLGDPQRAADLLEDSLRRLHAMGAAPTQTTGALINLGWAYWALGDYPKALDRLEESRRILEAAGTREGHAETLMGLGNVYVFLGDADRARALFEEAGAAERADGDLRGAALAHLSLGLTYLTADDPKSALAKFEEAREALRPSGDAQNLASALTDLGLSHEALGDLDAAAREYGEARAVLARLGDRIGQARADVTLANLRRKEGKTEEALALATEGLRAAEAAGSRDTIVRGSAVLAHIRLDLGHPEQALEPAHHGVETLAGLVRGHGDRSGSRAREGFEEIFRIGTRAGIEAKSPAEAWYFLESGRAGALLEALGGREAMRVVVVPQALRDQEAEAVAAEAVARARQQAAIDSTNVAERRARAEELEAASRRVMDVIDLVQRKEKGAADVAYPKAAALADVQARLADGEALVIYGLMPEASIALVVTPAAARLVPLASSDVIRAAVTEAMPDEAPYVAEEGLAKLARLVAEPLALGDGVRRVLVSPDGPLAFVPFAALWPGRDVSYVPSGTTYRLLSEDRAKSGEKVLALGDPEYGAAARAATPKEAHEVALLRGGRRLSPLPATRDEAKAVGDEVLLGPDASEAALLSRLASRPRWRAVHLACHGLVNAEVPALSSLALSNGDFWTTLEVFRSKVPADLVTLSACQTARGRVYSAEGVVGFVRAFLFAGAPRVIASLWKVDDDATSSLMRKFYALWNPKDGSKPLATAAALRAAQEYVRTHEIEEPDAEATKREGHPVVKRVRHWEKPYYWAAWVLWGLPD